MRALSAVLFLSLSGLAARAQEGMMAPPADAGQGGT